jgi:SulP family sulfate permease
MLDASGARAVAQIVADLHDRHIHIVLKVESVEHTRLLRAVGALGGLDEEGLVLTDLPSALERARTLAGRPKGDRAAVEV